MLNRQQLISSAILIGMLLGYWFILGQRELSEIRSIKDEVRVLRSSLIASDVALARLQEVQEQVDEVDSWLETVQTFYEADEETSAFLLEIARTLEANELTPSETSPGPVQALEPLTRQSIRIVVEGDIDDVFNFLRQMEDGRPLCRVTGMIVEPSTSVDGIRADLTLLRMWKGV